MNAIAIREPKTALTKLLDLLVPNVADTDSLELQIHIDNDNIVIRDIISYLQLIDHIYGRMQKNGFLSYSMKPCNYLQIAEVRHGSTIFTLLGTLMSYNNALLVLFVCLRFLPLATESLTRAYRQACPR